jgi:hypothetical protein
MKNRIVISVVALSTLLFVQGVLSENGKAGKTGAPGEGTCVQCHAGTALNAGGGYVFVESSNMIFGQHVLGQTYDMSVTVGQTGNGLFGFSVVALDSNGHSVGTFTAGSDNHTENFTIQGSSRQYVTHNLNGGLSQDEHTFNFTWTAPSEDFGTITFYATGLAANGNGMNAGDKVYSATMESPVMPVAGMSSEEQELSFQWDPMTKALVFSQASIVGMELTVFDLQGRIVVKPHEIYDHVVGLRHLSSGCYLIQLRKGNKNRTEKIYI